MRDVVSCVDQCTTRMERGTLPKDLKLGDNPCHLRKYLLTVKHRMFSILLDED